MTLQQQQQQQCCLSSVASESAGRNHCCAVISRFYETEVGKCLSLQSPWDPAPVQADPAGRLHALVSVPEGGCPCPAFVQGLAASD